MSARKILYQSNSKFNDILVTQEGNILTLHSPPATRQTAIDTKNPTVSHLEYARNILPGLLFAQNPKSILMLGLGGGVIPVMLTNVNKLLFIDIVEIDPEIAVVAKKYFHFKTSQRLRLFIEDAFQFIKDSEETYDIIIMDAYIGNDLPQPLSTSEFFKEADRGLTDKGILIVNLMSTDRLNYEKMLQKISSVFDEIWLLHSNTSSNTIAFAMNRKVSRIEIMLNALSLKRNFPTNYPLLRLAYKIKKFKP
tara:strand:+ start:8147 stop:8899 length:753 start_codon:yes stop_codon:yes gene_type:complete